ncbi:MAG: protein phosphatase 2C domain-containing protein [Gloeotrichia echinulata IR180]|jgi:serine/threonine protein phosphatase PrpC|nr:protein phosphatase 2C domain-containing protein [Gloeotrichia echinulata DEX184]
MKLLDTNSNDSLTIQTATCCQIDKFKVQIESHLGQFADVHYFQVTIHNPEQEAKLGLLRVGAIDGALSRELQLRKVLGNHKMLSELLACVEKESVYLSSNSPLPKNQPNPDNSVFSNELPSSKSSDDPFKFSEFEQEIAGEPVLSQIEQTDPDKSEDLEQATEYLDEEFYDEEEVDADFDASTPKHILLSYLPKEEETLKYWLTKNQSLESSLLLASQVCQFFKFIYQRQWCFIQIFPKFIQMGTPVKFFDLTGAYPIDGHLTSGLMGEYCAPEIAYDSNFVISEQISTYIVGALLYEAIHHQLPPQESSKELEINPIPSIYQILKLSLSPFPEERFSLTQLLSLLVDIRKSIQTPQIYWEVATHSIVGLSTSRLHNEDSYGVRRHNLNNSDSLILGVIADGLGGMAQGELASKLAVQTVLETPITADLTNQNIRGHWLISLVEKANNSVAQQVRDGGTTISLVMGLGRELMIAHVGDSRIFLLRNGQICQLSEDHSLVAMLFASGEITYEESLNHPDRNVLTKSLGSKRKLSPGYVQDLNRFGAGLSMLLEDGDILILCSDGVWDLVPADELAEIFSGDKILQSSADLTIKKVLERGAHDNATILALKLRVKITDNQ